MTTFQQLIIDVARELTDLIEGTASSGTSATCVDTSFGYRRANYSNDYFNNGTIFFLTGSANAGKYFIITDFAISGTPAVTGTFTFTPPGSAVVNGDGYLAMRSEYPLDVLKRAVNQAIRALPPIWQRDDTLTTVADQLSYNLPAGVAGDMVKEVWVATRTSSPYYYERVYDWKYDSTKLYFSSQSCPKSTGYYIRLVYYERPAELSTYSDTLSGLYHPDLVAWMATLNAAEWRTNVTNGQDQFAVALLNRAEQKVDQLKREYYPEVETGNVKVTLRTGPIGYDYNDDITKVRL